MTVSVDCREREREGERERGMERERERGREREGGRERCNSILLLYSRTCKLYFDNCIIISCVPTITCQVSDD